MIPKIKKNKKVKTRSKEIYMREIKVYFETNGNEEGSTI
jgi:hypothetical protein